MGNTSSSKDRASEEVVDFGYLVPQGGIYPSAARDWNQAIVSQLIVHRKLAPFYRPLEDYQENWDDEQILASQKRPSPQQDGVSASSVDAGASSTHPHGGSAGVVGGSGHDSGTSPPPPPSYSHAPHLQSATSALRHAAGKSSSRSSQANKESQRNLEAQVYRGAVDCPICFLAICTECFVHIKRADPTTTHLVSEPACCPYCMQPNFGITYVPPNWRQGIGAESGNNPRPEFFTHSSSSSNVSNASELGVSEGKRRRKSISHTSREVVTIDQIRPDWEQKLNAVRAAVARRANRRIVMRQVGDQLIPVGITSGRVVALPPGAEGNVVIDEGPGSRRRRRAERNGANPDFQQFLGQMGMGGQDIEELMIMEAMRLSMVDETERIRRQQEQERQAAASGNANGDEGSNAPPQTPGSAASESESQQQLQMSSSYRPPAPGRLHEQPPQLSSSLPNSSLMLPNASSSSLATSSQPNHHTPSRYQPPPSPSALGGATASLALAFGAPTAQSQSGLVREGPDGSRSYPAAVAQTSALSAMLGATNTAAAIIGSRGSPTPQQLAVERPILRAPSPVPWARQERAPSEANARENSEPPARVPHPVPLHAPIPVHVFVSERDVPSYVTRNSPAASGATTPTGTAASTSTPALSHRDLPAITTSSAQDTTQAQTETETRTEDAAVTPPQTLTQLSQLSLLTPGSINSETVEEYDVLPSSPPSSDESELIAHTPLIPGEQDESAGGDLPEERRSEGTQSDDGTQDGEQPLRVSDEIGMSSLTGD